MRFFWSRSNETKVEVEKRLALSTPILSPFFFLNSYHPYLSEAADAERLPQSIIAEEKVRSGLLSRGSRGTGSMLLSCCGVSSGGGLLLLLLLLLLELLLVMLLSVAVHLVVVHASSLEGDKYR